MTGTLLRNELRMLLRDTRTLLIAVVAPLVLFPLFIVVTGEVEEREVERLDRTTYLWGVAGDQSEWAAQRVQAALALDGDTGPRPADFRRVEVGTDPSDAPARIQLADSLLRTGELNVLVVGRQATSDDGLPDGVRVVELRYRSSSDVSRSARDRLQDRLVSLRESERDRLYSEAGFPVAIDAVIPLTSTNVATSGKQAGLLLGQLLVPFLVLLMLSGGSIVAADTISGEKERGTLETLLTTAAARRDIVRSKLLAVLVVGLVVAAVNVANLAVYLGIGVIELPPDLQLDPSVFQLAALLVLFLPLAALVAAALLLLSGIAKSYREYQIYFFPLFLVFLLPSLAGFLPGVELGSAIALMPVGGIAVATRSVLTGEGSLIWGTVAFVSTALAASVLLARTEAALSNERLISRDRDAADFHGGAALFPRHVLSWFLGLWVLFFLVSLWFGETLGLRGSIVVNLVGIFLGGTTLLLHRYRLDPVEAMALRRPHWTAWPAAVIGAPSLLVLGIGVAELVNTYLFPVPETVIEAFARGMTMDLSVLQLTFFLALLPGVLEEIAFRGVLLHGLRRRLASPWAAALACGAVFGLFHVSLFRIVPTGLLGVALALVVIRTGSIYPAMLWHFLNNALAIVPVEMGWLDVDAATVISPAVYGAAFVGAAITVAILARIPRPQGRPARAPSRGPPAARV